MQARASRALARALPPLLRRGLSTALCWGASALGATGQGDAGAALAHHGLLPPALPASLRLDAIAAGARTSAFVSACGAAYTCGSGPALGLGGAPAAAAPQRLALAGGALAQRLYLGEGTGVALERGSRSPQVWGTGSEGQLGLGGALGPQGSYHGGEQPKLAPAPRALDGEALAQAALARHRTLLLSEAGTVYTTGSGFLGELGGAGGASGVLTAPRSVAGLPPPEQDRATAIAAGLTFSLAATASGRLFFWGQVGHGGSGGGLLRHALPTELALPGRLQGAPPRRLMLAAGLHFALVTDGAQAWVLGASLASGGFEEGAGLRPLPLPRGLQRVTHVAAGAWTAGLVGDEAHVWLAGRLESPYLLGGEAGPGAARCLAEHAAREEAEAGGGGAGAPPAAAVPAAAAPAPAPAPAPPLSRAQLLEELGLEDEIGFAGARNGDGLRYARGALHAPRLVRVLDKALEGRRVVELALGAAHGVVLVE